MVICKAKKKRPSLADGWNVHQLGFQGGGYEQVSHGRASGLRASRVQSPERVDGGSCLSANPLRQQSGGNFFVEALTAWSSPAAGLVIEDGHSSPFQLAFTTAHYLHHALYNWSRGYRGIFGPSSPVGPPLMLMISSKGVKPLSSVATQVLHQQPVRSPSHPNNRDMWFSLPKVRSRSHRVFVHSNCPKLLISVLRRYPLGVVVMLSCNGMVPRISNL